MTDNPVQDEDIMDLILRYIGELGTYQRWLVAYLMPFGTVFGFVYCIQMFIAATPEEHWCRVPELLNLTLDLRRNLSIPGAATGSDWDRCMMYDANWTQVLQTLTPPSNDTALLPCRNGWEFLYNDIPYQTVTSQREWVCDRAGYAPFAQFMFFVGSVLGCLFFGWIGDAFGRIPAFVGANIIGFVGSTATMFTSDSWDFVLCRFLTGISYDSNFIMIYILVLEYVGPKHRTWVTNMSYGLFVSGFEVLIPPLILWLLDWRKLVLITALPMLLALPAPWIVPESARWLTSKGKVNKALKVLRKFEKINKKNIPEDVIEQFSQSTRKGQNTFKALRAVLRSTPLRNSLLVLIVATSLCVMSMDSEIRLTENVGYNFFIAFAASAFAELPAMLVVTLTIDRFGRRPVIIVTLLLAAICSYIAALIARGFSQMIITVTTRFFVNIAVNTLMQMGPELLPTPVRATGTSIIHVTMFTSILASPYIVFSGRFWRPLPAVIVGCMCVLGSGISLLLPETMGQPMPQTIADGEKLARSTLMCLKPKNDDNMEELHLKSKE